MTLQELTIKGFTTTDTIIHLLHCTRVRTLSVEEVQFLESNFLNKPEPKIKYVDDMDKSCPYTSKCDTLVDKKGNLICNKCPKVF